jgi:hypothetical protein
MPSVAEVRVCDALSSEDAASLEEDDAPQERKPPKDFNVSFAQSVSRTANVYNSARPPSRRGVSSRSLKTRHTLPKRSDKGDAFSGGFGGSLSQVALERDPHMRRLHEEAKATRSLAKRYKAQLGAGGESRGRVPERVVRSESESLGVWRRRREDCFRAEATTSKKTPRRS